MATAYELTLFVQDFAKDLALALPDPTAWGICLVMLLEVLEKCAADDGQSVERFDATLELLQQIIGERLASHQ